MHLYQYNGLLSDLLQGLFVSQDDRLRERLIVGQDHLHGQSLRGIHDDWTFEIRRPMLATFVEDRKHEDFISRMHLENIQIAALNVKSIFGDEPPRRDHRQSHIRQRYRLQPSNFLGISRC